MFNLLVLVHSIFDFSSSFSFPLPTRFSFSRPHFGKYKLLLHFTFRSIKQCTKFSVVIG